jgi:hypothetical protein
MLDDVHQVAEEEGASELDSKQHRMWISELLWNSWTTNVIADMNAFEEETQDNGVILYCIFLCKHIGFTNEVIIASKAQLTKEKLALKNFQFNILKFTTHVRAYICCVEVWQRISLSQFLHKAVLIAVWKTYSPLQTWNT